MSTRSQVKVIGEGLGEGAETVTLYHHSDGYPSNMLPVIREGYQQVLKKNNKAKRSFGGTGDYFLWEGGRPGKAAGFLCAADPGGFEPEEGHELHGDIEWYYVLRVINKTGGSMGEKPEWVVDVYEPPEWEDVPMGERQPVGGARHQFWNDPKVKDLHIVAKGINVSKLTEAALRKKGLKLEGREPSKSMMAHAPKACFNRGDPGWHGEPGRHALAAKGIKTHCPKRKR